MKSLMPLVVLAMLGVASCSVQPAPAPPANAPANANTTASTNTNTAPATTAANTNASAPMVKPAETTSAGDNVYVHQEAGIRFEVPKTWTAEAEGEQMTISTPDDSLAIVFLVSDAGSLDAALQALEDELGKLIQDAEITVEPTETTINGLKSVAANGTGQVEGKNVTWSVDVIAAKKPVIVLSIIQPEAASRHNADLKEFISSIRAA
jgi:predicted Zn-dependent protease